MKEILLTQDKVALVSDEHYDYLSKFNWHYHKQLTRYSGYARRNIPLLTGRQSTIFIHQVIIQRLGLIVPYNYEIDHKDRDGLNNQNDNLRVISRTISMFNMKLRTDNSSGYRGVCFDVRHYKWKAYIKLSKERINLGTFETRLEAIEARLKAEERYKKYIDPVELNIYG